jgi:hypothetical protein
MQSNEDLLATYPHVTQSGIVEGVYYGQNARVDELNERIGTRHFPDLALPTNFDPRPTPTKRQLFPMLNIRSNPHESIRPTADFSVESNFYPGSDRAPAYGYAANVETEMQLRNSYFALQRGDQGVYVPSTDSDLYKVTVVSRPSEQPHPDLFARPTYSSPEGAQYLNPEIGGELFYNNTRTQLRNMMP